MIMGTMLSKTEANHGQVRRKQKMLEANQGLLCRPGMVLFVGWLELRGELEGMFRMHGFQASDKEIKLPGGVNLGAGPVHPNS